MSASTRDLSSDPYAGASRHQRNIGDPIGTCEPLAPERRRSAALTVAENAHDAADARLLLALLGLDEKEDDA